MATLVIRVVDKVHPDPVLDASSQKRGDVIAVLPDSWIFSPVELSCPDWRIVSFPQVSESVARTLVSRGLASWEGEIAPFRGYYLDLGHPALATIEVESPSQVLVVDDVVREDLESARCERTPVSHPYVFGEPAHEIGRPL